MLTAIRPPFTAHTLKTRLPVAAIVVCLLMPTIAAAGTIPRELQRQIPRVVKYLNDKSHKTVGVLKFRVKKPGEKTSDSVGPLNSLLADRLEVGLILGNPFDESRQLNIIKDASSQVAAIEGANHLSDEGRQKFFGPQFKLAWGNETVTADAFLTGVVQVHPDNQTVTVGILCFDKNGGKLEKACDVFDATLDATSLGEMGESFVLRGAFDGGSTKLTQTQKKKATEIKQQEVLKQAAEVKKQLTSFPLEDTTAPVRLEITYDNQPVTIETRDGQAFVKEPQQGQQVQMAIVRTSAAKGRLGIVLKVNGENTLYRQTISDLECSKWILSDDHVRTIIKGYQIEDSNTAESFKVLSSAESASRAVDYGRNVGQIQMTVFKEENLDLANDLPPALPDEDEEDLAAMLRGIQPQEKPDNLSALKHQLRTAGRDGSQTRGLIVQGEQAQNNVRTVTFTPDPTPVMSVTITYYTP